MNKAQREQKINDMLLKIRRDLQRMQDLLNPRLAPHGEALISKAYLDRQVGKYLKPLTNSEVREHIQDLMQALQIPPLLNVPDGSGAVPYKKPVWDTEGDGPEHLDWRTRVAFGWASVGKMGGHKIRITKRAFLLFSDTTLRGVMLHEATHFALDTDDIHYSSFHLNSVLKDLPNGHKNADNWRIFYQKMSKHFSSGIKEEAPQLAPPVLGPPFKLRF
ncbi:hypothetical protein [Terriglobus saanensis]|uniref:Uncharacterized protein n=1 Tax=Terriglobus saanensis (strain ATCC BAA-1853 / DSM 23119 / SP1PR4) TaxID=401053 RepID=E8V232_TERSS|nr:hypothetical protein [Terriglobus saanensis]ADV84589.1 hypothetical protein AciPR4_3840 [Terriglobus saanensis SP1PR4]